MRKGVERLEEIQRSEGKRFVSFIFIRIHNNNASAKVDLFIHLIHLVYV